MCDKLILKIAMSYVEASRGNQVVRKDKDLMRDTGGTSKGRNREPQHKPPRSDKTRRYRDKRLKPEQRDKDVNLNNDREVKKPNKSRKAATHPLDRKVPSIIPELMVPENNHVRQVFNCLVTILEDERDISEKDFSRQEQLKEECNKIFRNPAVEMVVARFQKMRPEYCAECIFNKFLN